MTELEKQMENNPEIAKAFSRAMDLSNLMIIAPHKTKYYNRYNIQRLTDQVAKGAEAIIQCAYESSLKLAKENQCHSIGFPLISAGVFGYPLQDAWNIAVRACLDFIEHNPDYDMEIVFAVLSDSIIQEGRKQLALDLDERIYFLKGGLNAK